MEKLTQMATKKLSPEVIKEAIIKTASNYKRKQVIAEAILTFEKELGSMQTIEEAIGFVGSQGFAHQDDIMNKVGGKTGFVNEKNMNISRVAELMKDYVPETEKSANLAEEQLLELSSLKAEVEKLREENKNLKNK